MPTIPANTIVDVVPSVISAGGDALDVIGLFLTTNTRVPVGTVMSFSSALAVSNFFGPTSKEAAQAAVYFGGFTGATAQPGALLFAQYNTAAVSAYLRGGNVSSVPLATLQGFNGLVQVTIDGNLKSATVSLAGATSFSNAGEIIGASLGIEGVQAAAFTGSISGSTLTVTAIGSGGPIAAGQVIGGTGVVANTYVTALLNVGAGGTGTFTVSTPQIALSAPMTAFQPGVAYDSVSGAFVVSSGTTGPDLDDELRLRGSGHQPPADAGFGGRPVAGRRRGNAGRLHERGRPADDELGDLQADVRPRQRLRIRAEAALRAVEGHRARRRPLRLRRLRHRPGTADGVPGPVELRRRARGGRG